MEKEAIPVFISYVKKDYALAALMNERLKQHGIVDWRFENNLKAGDDWRKQIEEAIDNSKIVIVILSQASCASRYVTYEWSYAMGKGKGIIPVLYEECDIHERLAILQYISFVHDHKGLWEEFVDLILQNHEAAKQKQDIENYRSIGETMAKSGFYKLTRELYNTDIIDGIKKAVEHVDILDSWMCEEIVELLDEIEAALARGVKFRIALLNPEFTPGYAIARQRSRDIRQPDDQFVCNKIYENISKLKMITHNNFDVRLFTCLPTIEYYRFDDIHIVGNILVSKQSKCSPHIWINRRQIDSHTESCDYFESIEKNFEDVFKNSTDFRQLEGIYIQELHHVNLPVTNILTSKDFYTNILRLKEIERPTAFKFGGAWYGLPSGQHLHLVVNEEATFRDEKPLIKDGKPPDIHFALRVSRDTFDEIHARVMYLKIPFLVQPYETAFLQLYILDPDRNVIEITADPNSGFKKNK
jgi:catechol 2,3-dioxygenase-like lactoylglutathione lyase family enzyme